MNNQPLVSVPVITYNSSNFVLETLESIKAQTYQNIELIISDDCSTDNTVELCQEWVEQNKDRFVRTQIITSEMNTGVSANLNRAEADCQGEWIKSVAGDDLLMPDSIQNYITYVLYHPETTYLFGRMILYESNVEINKHFPKNVFDYGFFELEIDEQLNRLIFEGNCIPGASVFFNRKKSIELGIKNDERIPFLEDWPKWINILERGVKMEYLDKVTLKYRIRNDSLSTAKSVSIKYIESMMLFNCYYRYPKWYMENANTAITRFVDEYIDIYRLLIKTEQDKSRMEKSYAYRIGKLILNPIKKIHNLFKR